MLKTVPIKRALFLWLEAGAVCMVWRENFVGERHT